MKRAPLDLPPEVLRRFIEDLRAYHLEPDGLKKDEIAARQLRAFREFQGSRLRLTDLKVMFEAMRTHL